MSTRKKRRYILIAVLCAVVLAALAGTYFLVHYGNVPQTRYEEMGKASLPTITCYYKNKLINRMYGYSNDMDEHYMRDTLYILQDTYDLDIRIDGTEKEKISDLRFRVFDMADNNLIQETSATDTITADGDALKATLNIENMIEESKEYSLEIILSTGFGRDTHYYCRIMRSSTPYLEDHIALIEKAHKGTFNYDKAEEAFSPYKSERDYLYDDTTDFSRVTLYSTISWISWDEMNVKETTDAVINIVDYDDELGFFRIDYQAGRELETTAPEYYMVSEYFRTRINETGTYLLDYERLADQIFYPSGDLVFSDHINLGLLSDKDIRSMCSPDGNQTAFVANKALWMMSSRTKEITSVFNFISDNADVRDTYDQHDINIVSVTDEGDIRFLVYGYMNKGLHEGECGIGLYTFRFSDLKVTEDAFIPSDVPYQLLKYSIGNLCYMNSNGTLYIMINGDVYSIDSETNAAVLEVEGLTDDTCKVSQDHSVIAWQKDGLVNDATVIHVLDMESLRTYEVTAEEGKNVKVLGFLNNDLIYGQGDAGMIYTDSNDRKYLMMSHMYATGENGVIRNENSEEGYYFIDAEQEYNRLIVNRVLRQEDYYRVTEDFTIFATELGDYPSTSVYSATEETRGDVTLLGLPQKNNASTPLNIITSTSVVFASDEVSDVQKLVDDKWQYFVYAKGRLISPESDAAVSVTKAYDNTGCVVKTNGDYFYRRGMRAAMAEIPQDRVEEAAAAYKNEKVLNVTGIEIEQALSFTARRIPLIWDRDEFGTYVIAGYTLADALMLYDIDTGETSYMSYGDAGRLITMNGRLFVYES